MGQWVRVAALTCLLHVFGPACAQVSVPTAAPAAHSASDAAAAAVAPSAAMGDSRSETLYLNQRQLLRFRASLMGRSPAERVVVARAALKAALGRGGPGVVSVWFDGQTAGLQVDGSIAFYLVAGDFESDGSVPLAQSAEAVRATLQLAVAEAREAGDLRRIGQALGFSLLATALTWGVVKALFAGRRLLALRASSAFDRWHAQQPGRGVARTYGPYARSLARGATTFVLWVGVLVTVDIWVTFVLGQFAYTRPWADRSTQWLLGLLEQFALAAASAVPGLFTAVLIFVLARLVAGGVAGFMDRVASGELVVGWLDEDTAGPTRRIGTFVIWLFALAMAYPFLPGANSEAFKGVSVLAGLMISLGASGVVGQVTSGLSLMYSRTLRVGEYVKIGDTEGTVTVLGLFATKVHTGLGEEVSLPNTVVFSQPVRNFSRLVDNGQFQLHALVTIGYATPWRQVHAMLLEAANRASGVAKEPMPFVVQSALSDFYVEYRLCAQSDRSAPRRRAEVISHLHEHIQDVFNENGVQIMSPHYRSDPPQPQVVPPAQWSPALAPRQMATNPPPQA